MKSDRMMILVTSILVWLNVTAGVVAQTPTTTSKPTPSPTPIIPPGPPQAGINLTVSPVFINLATDPGEPVSSDIRIINENNIREYLELKLGKFSTHDGESPTILDVTPDDEFIKWISFSQQRFILEPRESKVITFTIAPPPTAALGYYYSIMVTRIRENTTQEEKQPVLTGAPAISVLLDVRSPLAKQELQLVDFETDHFFYEYLPVEFRIKIKNTGNIHTIPAGNIFIDWGRRKNIGLLAANDGHGNVLPQTQRTYTVRWEDGFVVRVPKEDKGSPLKDARGNDIMTTKWDFSKVNQLRIGKYTAHLLMVYDNGQRDIPLEAQLSFWVIPWKIILVALVIMYFSLIGVKDTVVNNIKKVIELIKPQPPAV